MFTLKVVLINLPYIKLSSYMYIKEQLRLIQFFYGGGGDENISLKPPIIFGYNSKNQYFLDQLFL